MGVEAKVETEIELKSSADKYFKRLSTELHHAPAACDKVHSIDVHEGDWETPGSLKIWTYTLDGKTETCKERVEVDEESKTVTLVPVDGHVLEKYKSFKVSLKVVPKDSDHGVLKITILVEKEGDHVVDPHDYLELTVNIMKDLDEHLVAQAI